VLAHSRLASHDGSPQPGFRKVDEESPLTAFDNADVNAPLTHGNNPRSDEVGSARERDVTREVHPRAGGNHPEAHVSPRKPSVAQTIDDLVNGTISTHRDDGLEPCRGGLTGGESRVSGSRGFEGFRAYPGA
jgi:hypothetical protein